MGLPRAIEGTTVGTEQNPSRQLDTLDKEKARLSGLFRE
jgi:hypothetical protein